MDRHGLSGPNRLSVRLNILRLRVSAERRQGDDDFKILAVSESNQTGKSVQAAQDVWIVWGACDWLVPHSGFYLGTFQTCHATAVCSSLVRVPLVHDWRLRRIGRNSKLADNKRHWGKCRVRAVRKLPVLGHGHDDHSWVRRCGTNHVYWKNIRHGGDAACLLYFRLYYEQYRRNICNNGCNAKIN